SVKKRKPGAPLAWGAAALRVSTQPLYRPRLGTGAISTRPPPASSQRVRRVESRRRRRTFGGEDGPRRLRPFAPSGRAPNDAPSTTPRFDDTQEASCRR